MTELDTALAVASGDLPSPTRLRNSDFVALRISGTGCAYRSSLKEFVYRDKAVWLTDEMRRRCLGLPVIVEHPPSGEMTSKYFGDSAVGVVVATYVRDEELWGVARIVDAAAARMIGEGVFDTSPICRAPRRRPPAGRGGAILCRPCRACFHRRRKSWSVDA
jgi:colicin import membrane protein